MNQVNDQELKEIWEKLTKGAADKDEVIKFLKGINSLLSDFDQELTKS